MEANRPFFNFNSTYIRQLEPQKVHFTLENIGRSREWGIHQLGERANRDLIQCFQGRNHHLMSSTAEFRLNTSTIKMKAMPTTKSRADDLKRFFSFEGRATRTEWWLVNVAGLLAACLLFWLVAKLVACSVIGMGSFQLVVVVLILAYGWLVLATNVRRLHDMNRSGWWAALLLLLNSLGQLVAMVWLGFFDGTPGGNRFGSNPRAR